MGVLGPGPRFAVAQGFSSRNPFFRPSIAKPSPISMSESSGYESLLILWFYLLYRLRPPLYSSISLQYPRWSRALLSLFVNPSLRWSSPSHLRSYPLLLRPSYIPASSGSGCQPASVQSVFGPHEVQHTKPVQVRLDSRWCDGAVGTTL